jgi:gamma-glutamyltranspeptidase/glutathione hydrolase
MAKGIVAAGHELTVQAAEQVLSDGGNAFDAAIAAFYAACMAEPVLASPGGGGFLLARPARGQAMLYDFFVQTPLNNRLDNIDFIPITADFGEACQEFHIGLGSIAVPGVVRGIFQLHRDLASIPMRELVAPALCFAREGIVTNAFQSYILDIVSPIFMHQRQSRETFAGSHPEKHILHSGDVYYPDKLADTLEAIAIEGDRLFYEGELADHIVQACNTSGGLLGFEDLKAYECIKRKPLSFSYRNCRILSNPAPASGGVLVAFALKLLEHQPLAASPADSYQNLLRLIQVMEVTQQARIDQLQSGDDLHVLLDSEMLAQYSRLIKHRAQARRGTTHISIIDRQGNMAAFTLSNGEGCGYMLADTGIMLNNMLGEQDLNPHGFFKWQGGQRMTSMMAPSLMLLEDGRHVVTGSGGSNRIRTALMQVMVNIVDHHLPVDLAVAAPRLHYENRLLNIEGLFNHHVTRQLQAAFPDCQLWPERNLFFGGAHTVVQKGNHFSGAGDQRRGGVCKQVD